MGCSICKKNEAQQQTWSLQYSQQDQSIQQRKNSKQLQSKKITQIEDKNEQQDINENQHQSQECLATKEEQNKQTELNRIHFQQQIKIQSEQQVQKSYPLQFKEQEKNQNNQIQQQDRIQKQKQDMIQNKQQEKIIQHIYINQKQGDEKNSQLKQEQKEQLEIHPSQEQNFDEQQIDQKGLDQLEEYMNFVYPFDKDKLSIFITLGRQRQRKITKSILKNQNFVNQIQDLIFDKLLTLTKIQDLCQEHNIELMKALFLYTNNQEIILQLILEYLDDYSIIEYVIINKQFPKNQQLIIIAQYLLKKLRPSVRMNHVQMSLKFLEVVKNTQQFQILIDTLKIKTDINSQNQISQVQNLISYFNQSKPDHIKLIGKIAKLCGEVIDKDLFNMYQIWKKNCIFHTLKIPKSYSKDPGTDFKIELETLNYNLFHEIAIRKNWQQFIQYSNPYYHQKSVDNRTPFLIFLQKAPIQIIVDYINKYPNELEQNIEIITNQGFTLIHSLCKNNNLEKDNLDIINQLISILNKKEQTIFLLNVAYQDQIPLVYYLDNQKNYKTKMIEFLSSSLIKQFNFEKLEIEAYLIADQILNQQISIKKAQPYFKQLSKRQQNLVKYQWIEKKDELKNQSEYLEFTQFYQHYIQLSKQIIKNNLFDQFLWINNYTIYSCHIPFDIGNIRSSLLYTLLAYQRYEQFNSQIQILCKKIQTFKYDEKQNLLEYQNIVQQISRLLFIYQELYNYPELQQSQILIINTISNIIKENSKIILNKVYGLFKNEILAENLYLQYLMKITMSSQEYIKFLKVLFSYLQTDQYEISIRTYFKSYGKYKTSIRLLNQQIFVKDELIIKLKKINKEFGPQKKNYLDQEDILNLLKQSLTCDIKSEVFLVGNEIILRSNSILFQIMEKSFKLQTIFHSEFFNIKSLWLLLRYRNYDKKQLSQYIKSQVNQIVKIKKVQTQHIQVNYLIGNYVFFDKKKKYSLKEQIILKQIKYNYEFAICLILYDDFHSDMKMYFKQFPDKLKYISHNNFPLSQIISNKAIKNLQFIIQELKLSKLELISILTTQFFCLNNFIVLENQFQKGIINFNEQMRFLLQIIQNNDYERKNLMSPFYIQYFEKETICQIEEILLSEYFDNERLNIFLSLSQNKFKYNNKWTDEISIILLDICFKNKTQIEKEQLDYLLYLQAFPIIDRWIVLNLASIYIKFNEQQKKFYLMKFFNYAINYPDECWQLKLKLDFTYHYYISLFLYAINSKDLGNQTRLLWFHNLTIQFGIKHGVLAVDQLKCRDGFFLDSQEILENGNKKHKIIQSIQFLNSQKFIKFSKIHYGNFWLALDIKQLKNFIDEVNLTEEDYLIFIKIFIINGLIDKLKLVFHKIQIKNLLPKIIGLLILIKQYFLNSIFEQKIFETEIIEDQNENNNQKINYLKFNIAYLFYVNQKIDYLQTFAFIRTQIQKLKLDIVLSQSDYNENKLLDLLIFPNTPNIQLNSKLVNIIINIFINRKSNYKSKNSIFNSEQFVKDRMDDYIRIIKINVLNHEFVFQGLKYITEFQKEFFEKIFVYISELDQKDSSKIKVNYEELANLIIRSEIKNEKLNNILEKGLNCINHVSYTIKFYLFKGANLRQQILKGVNHNVYYGKFEFLEQWLSVSQQSLNLINYTDLFFLKGLQELITKKIQFDQKYLISSLLYCNLDTINFVMKQHENPVRLGFEQNLFQILVIYSNEKDIITYYNQYVYKKINDNRRLFQINNISILYYIVQKGYQKVFFEVYLKQLQDTLNENEINNFISQQLLQNCPQSSKKIYQQALELNCFFLLEYMKKIIIQNDIEVFINQQDVEFEKKIKNYTVQTQFILKFIQIYEDINIFQQNKKGLQKIQYQDECIIFFASKYFTFIQQLKTVLYLIFEMKKDLYNFINNNFVFFFIFNNNSLEEYNTKCLHPVILSFPLKFAFDKKYQINNQQMKDIIIGAQSHGLLSNIIYNQFIQKMSIQLLNEIQIQNFTLQNSLAMAKSIKEDSDKQKIFNFLQQQMMIQKSDKLYYLSNPIYLIILLLNLDILNNSELKFIKIYFSSITKAILIQSIEFLQQFIISEKKPLSANIKQLIFQITTDSVSFEKKNEEIFWMMVQNNQIYYPILSEILTIKQIESLCHQLIRQMNYQFIIKKQEVDFNFIISFDDIDIQYNEEFIIIPLEYDDNEIFITVNKVNQFLKHYKKIIFKQNADQEVLAFQEISDRYEKFELYSFLTDLDVETIPILMGNQKTFAENFFIFQDVMIDFKDLEGNYSLLDPDAPHLCDETFFENQKDEIQKLGLQNKQQHFNNSKNLQLMLDSDLLTKQEFQFILSLLMNDSKNLIEKQPNIYIEFYNFYNPKKTIVKFDQCSKIDFETQANGQNAISFLLAEFYKYYENIKNQILHKDYKQWEINLPYYIDEYGIHYEKSLFSTYTLQIVLEKLYEFKNQIKELFVNNTDQEKVSWRINAISFLQVLVSNLINFTDFKKKVVDILSLFDLIFNWSQLKLLLLDLVYINLKKQSKIQSFIKRIYVEFNEVSEIPFENSFIEHGLETFFRFGQTNYQLQQQNLIIQLNILNIKQQLHSKKIVTKNQKKQNLNLLKEQELDYYYYNIINQEDMLFQIFDSNQLIQYLFQKFEIDRKFQEISQNFIKMLNKDVTISIHQQSLFDLFRDQINDISQLKDRKQQMEKQYLVKYQLEHISNFFQNKVGKMLNEQLMSFKYENIFQIMISKFVHSLRQNFDLSEQRIPNYRKILSVEKTQVAKKFRYPNRNCDKLIQLKYGFQLKKSYYLCQNKIGDLLLVCFKKKQQVIKTILCQLIDFQQGHFGFKVFSDEDKSILSEEQAQQYSLRLEKQSKKVQKNEEIEIVKFENLITIVYFMNNWPIDQDFINNILNIFITDQNGNLYLINEYRFLKKMIQIQETDSDSIRKKILDQTFGQDQITIKSNFAVSEILPIFPKIIQFYFVGDQKFERKEEQPNFKYIDIKIKDQDFQIINMRIDNLNTACYFDTHLGAQQYVKKLIKFKNNNKEFAKIQIIVKFSDSLDQKASLYLDLFFQQGSSFEEFQIGYEEFLADSFGSLTQNSLSIFFDVSEIEIKKQLFKNLIKIIQFNFDILTEEENKCVEFKNGILQIASYIQILKDGRYNTIIPQQNEICQLIRSLIIQDQSLRNNFFIENQQYKIEIDFYYQEQFSSKILSLLILVKYLYYLIILKDDRKVNFIITQNNNLTDIFYYRILKEKRQVQLFYENFKDLNLQDFLLDYLNGFTTQKIAQYDYFDEEILYQNQILTKTKNFKLIDFVQIQKQNDDQLELFISYNKKKLIKLEGQLDPSEFESAFLIIKDLQRFQKILPFDLIHKIKFLIKIITLSILLIEFTSNIPIKFKIKSKKFKFSSSNLDWHSKISLIFKSINETELQIGYHTGIQQGNKITSLSKEQKIIQNYFGNDGYSNLTKNLIKRTLVQNENFNFKAFEYENINRKFIQQNNFFNIQRKEDLKYSTKAGEERTDIIEFEDNFGNIVKNITIQSCIFVHSIYFQVQIKPQTIIEDLGLKLVWTPEIKGIYLLYINEQQIQGKFIILANLVCFERSNLEFPQELKILPYYQEFSIKMFFRDYFNNIYGDLENNINKMDLKIQCSPKHSIMEQERTILGKSGQQQIKVKFTPNQLELLKTESINLILKINGKEWLDKQLILQGQSFEQNLLSFIKSIHLNKDGSEIYRIEKKLYIQRQNFLQCLQKLESENLKNKIKITFQGEQGLDQGGLKKDFYFMIGEVLIQKNYGFFILLPSGHYFFNDKFLIQNKIFNYALIFGKLVANSIFNNYQIGIQFSPQFWKVLFEEKIQFTDLYGFLDQNTYKNYSWLFSLNANELESQELNFTYNMNNLIPQGDKVKVNKKNCQEYLDKTAEYLIQTKFQELFTNFRNGFSTVLDIQNLKKYFQPNDMGLITLGIQEINPQQLLNMIIFKGGQDYHEKFFITYVYQLDGTPTLPMDRKIEITVEFIPDIKETLTPTSQTCFNTIQLPLYKSYEEMKLKLDIRINYGLVGFQNK